MASGSVSEQGYYSVCRRNVAVGIRLISFSLMDF